MPGAVRVLIDWTEPGTKTLQNLLEIKGLSGCSAKFCKYINLGA